MELADKVALVTGGGRGIGRGIVESFLDAGTRVVVAQRSALTEPLASDARVAYVPADLEDAASLAAVVQRAVDAFGRLDVLVNCAGIMFERDPTDLTIDEWDRMVALNLRAPMFLTQAALRHFPPGSSVINIGSIEGLGANPGHAAYSATKGGVHAMTRALAVDLGPRGVRCNAIAPGWIDSDLSREYLDSFDDPTAAQQKLVALHPTGRLGRPTDIGDAAVFLASERASFLTGETIVVDGGRTARLPLPG